MEQVHFPEQQMRRRIPLLDLLALFENDPEFGERITAVRKARDKADPEMGQQCLEFLAAKYMEFAGPVDPQLIPHYREKIEMLQDAVEGKSGSHMHYKFQKRGVSAKVLRASMFQELATLLPIEERPIDENEAIPKETLLEAFDGKNQLDPYRTVEGLMLLLGADKREQQMVSHHINPAPSEFDMDEELLMGGLDKLRAEFHEYDLQTQRQFYNGNSLSDEARHYDRRRMIMSLLVGEFYKPKSFGEIVEHFEAPYRDASIDMDLAPGIHRDIHVIAFDMLEFTLARSDYTPQKLLSTLRAQ